MSISNVAPEGNNARKLSKNSTRFRLKCVQMSVKAKFTRKFSDDVAKVQNLNKLGKVLYVDYCICSATGNVRTSTKTAKRDLKRRTQNRKQSNTLQTRVSFD